MTASVPRFRGASRTARDSGTSAMTPVIARRSMAVSLLILALGLFSAPMAVAHTSLVSTSPSDGAVLEQPPGEVAFMFDEDLLPGANVIAITDGDGVVRVSETVEPQRNSVSLPWPDDLTPGTYQVAYRVVSADGHPVTGAILVTVQATGTAGVPAVASATPTVAAQPSVSGAPDSSQEPAWPNWIVAVIAALVALALVLAGITFSVKRRAAASVTRT